jgi:hypothetical protein
VLLNHVVRLKRKANNKNIRSEIFLILYLYNYATVPLYKRKKSKK